MTALLFAAALAAPPRLAVVEVAGARAVPPAFLTLLEAALLRSESVTLVERVELRHVLEERTITLALGSGADALAAAGALLSADALLLLEAGDPGRERVMPVRVRLVDARDGMKLRDVVVALEEGARAQEAAAGFVAARVVRRLGLAAAGAGTPVGVIGFTSEEVSRRWDWLSGSLSAGIEEHLGEGPGVVLLERERLYPHTEERVLTAGLPERLRTSAVLVDGSWRIAREGGAEEIALVLRGRRARAAVFEARLSGAAGDLAGLARRAAEEVRARLKLAGPASPVGADVEVAALLREADACSRLRESERALRMVEGAHALAPERTDVLFRLLPTGGQAFSRVYHAAPPRGPEDRGRYFREIVPICFRTLSVAERIVANELPHTLHAHHARSVWVHRPGSWYVDGLFDVLGYGNLHLGPAEADPGTKREMRGRVRALFARYRALVKGNDDVLYASVLAHAAKNLSWLCETTEEALRFSRGVQEETAALMRRVSCPECASGLECGIEPRDLPPVPPGGDPERWKPPYRAFVEDLLRHPDPLVRLSGVRASVRFEEDAARRAERAAAGLELLVELVGSVPFDHRTPWFREPMRRLVDAAFADPLARARWLEGFLEVLERLPVFSALEWQDAALAASSAWEAGARPGEALAVLDRSIAAAERRGGGDPTERHYLERLVEGRRQFVARHPEAAALAGGKAAPAKYRIERVARLEGVEGRRIVAEGALLAVVTVRVTPARPGGRDRVRWGLLRFDAKTRQPLPLVELDREVEFPAEREGSIDSGRMPPTAVEGAVVYFGISGAGIAVFPGEGPPRLLSEESGLADRRVRALEAVDGRLYALVGDPFTDSGLMEVDPATGRSRLLGSSRARERRSPLDGRFLQFLCADHERRALILGVEGEPGGRGPRSSLFVHDVRTGAVEPLKIEWLAALEGALIGERGQMTARRVGGLALITSFPFVWSIDLSARRIAPLLRSSQLAAPVDAPWVVGSHWPRAECFWGRRLVCREGAHLLCFVPGEARPDFPLDGLRDPRNQPIRDVAPDGDGLLLLDATALHRLTAPR